MHLCRHEVWFLLGFRLCAGLLVAQQSPETPPDPDSAKCVGAETCQTCHEPSYKSFADSAHARTLENPRPAERGCEGCHGPGADHVNALPPTSFAASAIPASDAAEARQR